jgi:hypothetical protein
MTCAVCARCATIWHMLVLRFSTVYPLASSGAVRRGTIALKFGTSGTATFTTEAGDVCTAIPVVAGQEIETGPLATVGALPAGTLGCVGR